MSVEKIFVIEHCEKCESHQWNTRHKSEQYKHYAHEGKYNLPIFFITVVVSAAIT